MPYIRRRRASGLREDEDGALETQGLLQPSDQHSSADRDHPDNEQVASSAASQDLTNSFAMGFKDWTQRITFFQGHAERSPLEKDLVRRLDIYLMTFGCSESETPVHVA